MTPRRRESGTVIREVVDGGSDPKAKDLRCCDERARNQGWARLILRAQGGDRESFRSLLNEIRPAILKFLRPRVVDPAELDDVCQETLLAIYESRHTYEPARPLEPWMFAIARYACASHFRAHRSRARWQKLTDAVPEDVADGDERLAARVRQTLRRLPRSQFEALLLTKVQGLSLTEASAHTGASIGTLKVRVHRAHAFLKQSLLD